MCPAASGRSGRDALAERLRCLVEHLRVGSDVGRFREELVDGREVLAWKVGPSAADEWEIDKEVDDAVHGSEPTREGYVLEQVGPALGRPWVDTLEGSRHAHMKELRPRGGHLRVVSAFDPRRTALLLLGATRPAGGPPGTSARSPRPTSSTTSTWPPAARGAQRLAHRARPAAPGADRATGANRHHD